CKAPARFRPQTEDSVAGRQRGGKRKRASRASRFLTRGVSAVLMWRGGRPQRAAATLSRWAALSLGGPADRPLFVWPWSVRMFGWLFGTRDLVVRLGRGEDRRAFVAALGDAELWLLSLRLDAALDPWPMTREQLLALKEANAKDLSERTEF